MDNKTIPTHLMPLSKYLMRENCFYNKNFHSEIKDDTKKINCHLFFGSRQQIFRL